MLRGTGAEERTIGLERTDGRSSSGGLSSGETPSHTPHGVAKSRKSSDGTKTKGIPGGGEEEGKGKERENEERRMRMNTPW